jgi:undecaprenyl-diphosphatase
MGSDPVSAALIALLLGLVQGATEFLPISSSAHLYAIPYLFGISDRSEMK